MTPPKRKQSRKAKPTPKPANKNKSPSQMSPAVEPLTPPQITKQGEEGFSKPVIPAPPKPVVPAPSKPTMKQSKDENEFARALAAAAIDTDSDAESDLDSDKSSDPDEVLDKQSIMTVSDQKFYRYMKGWTDIVTAIPKMSSVLELKTWVGGSIFRLPMMDYLKHFYWPQQTKKNRVRGENFDTHTKMGSRDLFREDVDRTKWSDREWTASTLFRLHRDNEADIDGLYPGQPLSERRKYMILFCLIKVFLKDLSRSRLDKGLPLLCLSDTEKSSIFASFPHVKEDLTNLESKVRTLSILS
jgi:hypothetical protein